MDPRALTAATATPTPKPGFARCEGGNATIEFVLWFPFLCVIFMFFLEATQLFNTNANVRRVAQDFNRQFVMGAYDGDTDSMETWLETALHSFVPNAVATAVVNSDGRLMTEVTYPASDVEISGWSNLLFDLTVKVDVIYQTEV